MFYDAMISKLITYSNTRAECIEKMRESLGQYVISGISNNISFLQAVLSSSKFLEGNISTNFLDEEYKSGFTGAILSSEESAVILCSALYIFLTEQKRASSINGQARHYQRGIGTRWVVLMDDLKYPVTVRPIEDGYKVAFENRRLYITSKWILGNSLFRCLINGKDYSLQIEWIASGYKITFMGSTVKVAVLTPRAAELFKYMKPQGKHDQGGDLMANISGMVVEVKVSIGDNVVKGQPLVILEAMKMENILFSQVDGIVSEISMSKGDAVAAGDLLIALEKKA